MKACPLIVADWVLVPWPEPENLPVWLALTEARPVTFTGKATKSPRQSGVSLMPNVNLAGYAPPPMKAPVLMPSDAPQSTVGQFLPWHLFVLLAILVFESGFSSRDVVVAVAGA